VKGGLGEVEFTTDLGDGFKLGSDEFYCLLIKLSGAAKYSPFLKI